MSTVLSWQYLTYNGGDCYKNYIVNIIGKFITGNMHAWWNQNGTGFLYDILNWR